MTQAMLMTHRRWACVGAVLAAGLLALPLRAEEPVASPARNAGSGEQQPYVVLIGISKYADKQIKPRPHAEADVKALHELLTNKKYLGVDAQHCRLLLGDPDGTAGSQAATRDNILKSLHWLADNAKSSDLVILTFIGEGGPLGESGDRRCYFASDSTFKGRDKDAITTGEIADALKNLKSQRFCALLDVDFKGFTSDKPVAEPNLGNTPYQEFLGDDGSEDHVPKTGRVLFLATNGLSRSLDLKDHGLFAEAILKGLKGAADKDGYEPDGVVTVDELTEYLDKEIPELAGKHGATKEEKQQLHFVLGGRGNHFALTSNPTVAAKVKERLDKFAEIVKDGTVPQRYKEEGLTLLSRMPRLEAQRNLRKQYQALVDGKITPDKFESERTTILDSTKLKRSDAMEFAQKVMEAIQIITDGYVKKVNQNDMVSWAIKGLYRRVDEKIPEKIDDQLKNIRDLKEADLTVLLADARQALGKREDLDKHKDIDFTLQRMLGHLDPYTTYIDPEAKQKMDQDIIGNFTGIGIQIRKDSASQQLLVVTPIKGSPAYKAGLHAGDLITTITREVDSDGKPLSPTEVIPTKGLPLSQAVKKILGQAGTKVKLTVKREGEEQPLEFEITRGRVEVESVLGYKRKSNDDWDYFIDPENKIGYIRLTSFARNSYRDMLKVMSDMAERGIKGFVLDLRFNPGGLLNSAVDISDLFIDDGLIVTIRPRVGRATPFSGRHRGSLLDFPMVCLVNGYSASGSEIVSAALQDNKRALIIGERSYGKGSVQNIQPFEGGELKLTTATFWRPNNKNLNKSSTSGKEEEDWGVIPDKVIKLAPKERDDLAEAQHNSEIIQPKGKPTTKKSDFKDRQLDEALKYLRHQIDMAGQVPAKKAG
jgi:carboxyl-terminal processing protease